MNETKANDSKNSIRIERCCAVLLFDWRWKEIEKTMTNETHIHSAFLLLQCSTASFETNGGRICSDSLTVRATLKAQTKVSRQAMRSVVFWFRLFFSSFAHISTSTAQNSAIKSHHQFLGIFSEIILFILFWCSEISSSVFFFFFYVAAQKSVEKIFEIVIEHKFVNRKFIDRHLNWIVSLH